MRGKGILTDQLIYWDTLSGPEKPDFDVFSRYKSSPLTTTLENTIWYGKKTVKAKLGFVQSH